VPTIISAGIRTQIAVMLRNFGRGIAEDIFLNLSITSLPGPQCQLEFQPSEETEIWRGSILLKQHVQLMTRPNFRLPPEADLMPIALQLILHPPIEDDFAFEGLCGSTGGETTRFHVRTAARDVIKAMELFMDMSGRSGRFKDTPIGQAYDDQATEIFNDIFFRSINAEA
jgi:hypothetical protein